MLPSDIVTKINECAKTDFVGMRDWWFGIVSRATALVAFGLIFEAPELIHDLIPIGRKIRARLKKLPNELPKSEAPDWVTVVAFIGWIFIVAGVCGEELAGIKVKDMDANIQECSDAKVQAATFEAGDAKSSSEGAARDADRAKKAADFAQSEVDALSPRSLSIEKQRKIAESLKPFAGHQVEIGSYGLDGEGTALATQLIALAFVGARLSVVDSRANEIVSGGFEWGISVRGPQSEMPLMLALQKSLTSIGDLRQVVINGPEPRTGAGMGGAAGMGGSAGMGGGGGPPVQGPVPTQGPVRVMVGIRPPVVLPKADKQLNTTDK